MVPEYGGRRQNLHNEILVGANGWGCDYYDFWGARQKDWASEILSNVKKSYIGATTNHFQTPSKNTPNMASASATDDRDLPSLSSPVLPCGNNGQLYEDVVPQLCFGQNLPPAAAAPGKHRHDTLMTRHAFT